MATIVDAGANKIKLNNGQVVTAQQGGWYDAQQYWGGTLSAPGVINSKSDQVGAGQAVSKEVIAQTNPNNVTYVNQQRQQAGLPPSPSVSAPQTTQQLQSTLNDFSSNLFSAANSVSNPGVQSLEEIAKAVKSSGLLPDITPPTPPNLTQQFQDLSTQKGLDAIATSITDLKAQQDELAAQLRVNTAAERGKPVAQNVIEGRISQEQRNTQEQYDFVSRQLARKVDEQQAALTSIQMIMNFSQQDFQNASTSYSTQFDQAISMINLVRGIQNDQKTDAQRAQDNARANLQIMTNAIINGNLSLGNLAPDQQAQLNRLEVQAGLPVGFMQSIHEKLDPKANIVATSTNNGQIQVLVKNPDGSMSLQSYGTQTGGSAITANTNNLKSDVAAKMTLDQVMKKYGNTLSPDTILATYNQYSPYGQAKESAQVLHDKYNVSLPSSSGKLSSTDQANVRQIKDDIANGYYTRAQAISTYPEYASYL